MVGDTVEHFGEPSLRVKAVHLGGFDEGIGDGRSVPAGQRPREPVVLSSKGEAALLQTLPKDFEFLASTSPFRGWNRSVACSATRCRPCRVVRSVKAPSVTSTPQPPDVADAPGLADAFSRTVEELTDEAETRDGVHDREAADVLYLRRGIEPEQAIAIERALRPARIVIREVELESPPPPAKAPGPYATALDYLLWCAREYRFLSHDEEAAYGEAVQRARLVEAKPASERSDSESRLLDADAKARSRLVLSNIRLVAKFANHPNVRGLWTWTIWCRSVSWG